MKDNILNISSQLFLEIGFKNVTMDDIAEKMGISKKTIYSFFKNKYELVKESTQLIFENACNDIERIKKLAKHPIEELYFVKSEVLKYFQNEKSSPVYQMQKYYPEIYNDIKNQEYKRLGFLVKSSLKEGIETGLFRKNIDIDFVSRLYMNGMRGIRDIDVFPPESFDIKILIEGYLEYHARAIVTEKGLSVLNKFISKNAL